MMHIARCVRVASTALALLVVGACSSGPQPPDLAAPKATGTVYVAGRADDGSAKVWRVTDGSAKPLLSGKPRQLPLASVSLSPDGGHLAYVSDGTMYVMDLRTGAAHAGRSTAGSAPDVVTESGMPDDAQCSTWSSDGKHVAFTVQRGVFVFDTAGKGALVAGRPVSRWREGQRDLRNLASAPSYHDASATSQMTCARWLGTEQLAFDRLGHDTAQSIGAAEADTTTLARVGTTGPVLTDVLARWTASDACDRRVLLDYHPEQSLTATPSPVANSGRGPGRPLIMAIDSLAQRTYADNPTLAARDLTATGIGAKGSVWYFTPGSCQLVTAAPKSQDDGTYDYLVTTVDGTSGATVKQRTLPLAIGAGAAVSRPDGGHVAANPASGAHTVAYATRDGRVGVLDLASGGATELTGPWKNAEAVLAWRAG
ncbi:TolB family protein [Streptomyces sp. DB-54]